MRVLNIELNEDDIMSMKELSDQEEPEVCDCIYGDGACPEHEE